MNLSYSPTPEYTFVVLPNTTGKNFAFEFSARFIASHQYVDDPHARIKALTAFQKMYVERYVEEILQSDGDATWIHESKDWDLLGVFYTWREFLDKYPTANVINIFPLDLEGNFGFMVANDM